MIVPHAGFAGKLRVAGPAVLLPVRTVGRNPGEVAQIALHRDLLKAVQGGVRRFKRPRLTERVVHKLRLDRPEIRQLLPRTPQGHLDIPEPVIGEAGMETFDTLSLQNVVVFLETVLPDEHADLLLRDGAVRAELFCVLECDGVARPAFHFDLAPAGEVGPEIVDCLARFPERDSDRSVFPHDPARFQILLDDQTAGRVALDRVRPVGIVEIRIGKAGDFQPGVVMFAVAEGVEGDRTVVHEPGGVGFRKECSVRNNVAEQFRPVAPWGLVETPGLGGVAVVPAVPQKNDRRVPARFQKTAHIVLNIRIVVIVLRDDGGQFPVVHADPVDEQLMPAEPAKIDLRLRRGFFALKGLAQVRRRSDGGGGRSHGFSGIDPVSVPLPCH